MKLWTYLFPKEPPQARLPLLSKEWSSSHSRYIGNEDQDTINLLIGFGVAQTNQDAIRLIKRYPDTPVDQIIKIAKRNRRKESKLRKAFKRLLKLW